jgi:hypothetical protein
MAEIDRLAERLEKDLSFREQERARGFTLEGMHRLYTDLANRVLHIERQIALRGDAAPFSPEADGFPELEVQRRRRSERAAAISMSAPGLHARFRGGAPTRFAMAFLVLAVVAAGLVGYAYRGSLEVRAQPHEGSER